MNNLKAKLVPAIIIHQQLLLDFPLWTFDNNNRGDNSIRFYEDAMKIAIGYKYANSHKLLKITYGGHLFAFMVSYHTQERPEKFYYWDITVWNETGGTTLGNFKIKSINKETDKLEYKDLEVIIDVCRKYVQGVVKCSACKTEIKKEEIAGRYFAGIYCKTCWETKYKAIEARETYN
jgi:hypothetical protein